MRWSFREALERELRIRWTWHVKCSGLMSDDRPMIATRLRELVEEPALLDWQPEVLSLVGKEEEEGNWDEN